MHFCFEPYIISDDYTFAFFEVGIMLAGVLIYRTRIHSVGGPGAEREALETAMAQFANKLNKVIDSAMV